MTCWRDARAQFHHRMANLLYALRRKRLLQTHEDLLSAGSHKPPS